MFIMGDGQGGHKIVIEPEIEQVRSDDEQADMGANVYCANKIIEKYVRLYPHEWGGWMHKRWKKEYDPNKHYYYGG